MVALGSGVLPSDCGIIWAPIFSADIKLEIMVMLAKAIPKK
jgi:hypothetical protein